MGLMIHCDNCDRAVRQGSPGMHGWLNVQQIETLENIHPSADGIFCTIECTITKLQTLQPKSEDIA